MELIEDDSNEKTNPWKRRTTLQKVLIISGIILLVVALITTIILLSKGATQTEENSCMTQSCGLVDSIANKMDPAVDPCGDFYSYACDGWIKRNPVPDGTNGWDVFLHLQEQNQMVVKNVLEQPIDNLKSTAEVKAKLFYESCMDLDTIEKLGAKPMVDMVKNLGNWSFNGFDVRDWDFSSMVKKVHIMYSVAGFFSYGVKVDDNSSKYTVFVGPNDATLPMEHYLNTTRNSEILQGCLDFMTELGVLLGGERDSVRKQMQKVLEFETRMANISQNFDSFRLTIQQLDNTLKFMDWSRFFEYANWYFDWKFNTGEKILVDDLQYLKELSLLIQEYLLTDEGRTTLNDYLMWQTVLHYTPLLSKPFVEAQRKFQNLLWNFSDIEEPQWKKCIKQTERSFAFATSAIFVREAFDVEAQHQFEDMAQNLTRTFRRILQHLQWMDEDTKKAAITKLNKMSFLIGYPKFIQNSTYYRDGDLTIRNDTYFANNVNVRRNLVKKSLKKINEAVERSSWDVSPTSTRAFYDTNRNAMVFPAGILQKPFYDPNQPSSRNYGAIGVLLAHELTHGFDEVGHQRDQNGNFDPWWSTQTEESFRNESRCFEEKYGNGSKNILSERVADAGGIEHAFTTYLDLMENEAEPEVLPKLDLSHRQLFFLAFAQVWCTSQNEQGEVWEYSMTKFRVNGALSNSKDFANEFGCGVGTIMNPERKCQIWREIGKSEN